LLERVWGFIFWSKSNKKTLPQQQQIQHHPRQTLQQRLKIPNPPKTLNPRLKIPNPKPLM
jgi:hypothetical protein